MEDHIYVQFGCSFVIENPLPFEHYTKSGCTLFEYRHIIFVVESSVSTILVHEMDTPVTSALQYPAPFPMHTFGIIDELWDGDQEEGDRPRTSISRHSGIVGYMIDTMLQGTVVSSCPKETMIKEYIKENCVSSDVVNTKLIHHKIVEGLEMYVARWKRRESESGSGRAE
jgi:hypothetical protein